MSGGGISRKISDRFPADLPRVGMENDLLDWRLCMAQGSSPLTRGKHIMRRGGPPARGSLPGGLAATLMRAVSLFREGLIPAYAGNTRRLR